MDSDSALWVISIDEPRIHITVTFSSVLMRDTGTGKRFSMNLTNLWRRFDENY